MSPYYLIVSLQKTEQNKSIAFICFAHFNANLCPEHCAGQSFPDFELFCVLNLWIINQRFYFCFCCFIIYALIHQKLKRTCSRRCYSAFQQYFLAIFDWRAKKYTFVVQFLHTNNRDGTLIPHHVFRQLCSCQEYSPTIYRHLSSCQESEYWSCSVDSNEWNINYK